MHTPVYPVSKELERYAERLFEACRRGQFSEVHMVLMKAKSWMEYEEPSPEEAGFWLGVLSGAPCVWANREGHEILRKYRRELCAAMQANPPRPRPLQAAR